MRHANQDPELYALVHRFVTPGRRYLKLGGSALRLAEPERTHFVRSLGEAAGEITPHELGILLDGGWRERKTAAWLIAVAGRTGFRDRLGELLLASEGPYAGQAYCVALATFGTSADAGLLAAYLDRYLARFDLDYDQGPAIGALLLIDTELSADNAARFLTPGGPWQQWSDGPAGRGCGSPESYRDFIEQLCAFAQQSARYCTAGGR